MIKMFNKSKGEVKMSAEDRIREQIHTVYVALEKIKGECWNIDKEEPKSVLIAKLEQVTRQCKYLRTVNRELQNQVLDFQNANTFLKEKVQALTSELNHLERLLFQSKDK